MLAAILKHSLPSARLPAWQDRQIHPAGGTTAHNQLATPPCCEHVRVLRLLNRVHRGIAPLPPAARLSKSPVARRLVHGGFYRVFGFGLLGGFVFSCASKWGEGEREV